MSRLPGQPVIALGIFRICFRDYGPWECREWSGAGSDGTFACRWDDPRSEFRSIYAAQQRLGAFMETLQRFVPPPDLLALSVAITYDSSTGPASLDPGVVPHEWAEERVMGQSSVTGTFANVPLSEALQVFREVLAAQMVHLGLHDLDFDLSTLLRRSPRALTQAAARVIYEDVDDFAGIACVSRMGIEFMNITLFERPNGKRDIDAPTRATLDNPRVERITASDGDLAEALRKLNLTLG